MASIDLKKVWRDQYTARAGKPALVTVPARPFLMIDGAGTPGVEQGRSHAFECARQYFSEIPDTVQIPACALR